MGPSRTVINKRANFSVVIGLIVIIRSVDYVLQSLDVQTVLDFLLILSVLVIVQNGEVTANLVGIALL